VDHREIERLLRQQCGVVSRRQVLAAGGTDNDLQRMVRRRELTRVFEGVYVDHTGALGADQCAWAAVLYAAPSALAGRDALRAHGVRGMEPIPSEPIRLVVPAHRKVACPPGVRVTRMTDFDRQVQHHLSPPRLRLEPAALQVASAARTEDVAVAVLSDVCQTRRTRPDRLLDCLRGTGRIRHRDVLETILEDVASGTFSALERRFLTKVERAHALPTGTRQRRVSIGRRPYYRDVTYVGLDTNVELDGRIGHDTALDRWADLERDITSARDGDLTVRVGWLQVLEAHRLADALGLLLIARGWTGRPRQCGPHCTLT
jgi:hypothetical protein